MNYLKCVILQVFLFLYFDKIIVKLCVLGLKLRLLRYKRCGVHVNFVPQGGYDLEIMGDLSKFTISDTSHLKSGTYIECTGGVTIGKYFHCGRGLTIFSTNHNYDNANSIPYDEKIVIKPVVVGDFVWCGANVTIVPGVTVGDGAILGAGSVITKNVPAMAIVGGNPAKVLKYRNIEEFNSLLLQKRFY